MRVVWWHKTKGVYLRLKGFENKIYCRDFHIYCNKEENR